MTMVSYYNPGLTSMFPPSSHPPASQMRHAPHPHHAHPHHHATAAAAAVAAQTASYLPSAYSGYHHQQFSAGQYPNLSDLNSNMYGSQFAGTSQQFMVENAGALQGGGNGSGANGGPTSPSTSALAAGSPTAASSWHTGWLPPPPHSQHPHYQAPTSTSPFGRAAAAGYPDPAALAASWAQHNAAGRDDQPENSPTAGVLENGHHRTSAASPGFNQSSTTSNGQEGSSPGSSSATPTSTYNTSNSNAVASAPNGGLPAHFMQNSPGAVAIGISSTSPGIPTLQQQQQQFGMGSDGLPLSPISGGGGHTSPKMEPGNGSTPLVLSTSSRPQPARSPYEWMKKPSYQSQPEKNGRTRTKDKYRVVYSDHQRLELEKEFHYSRYITIRRKAELANNVGLSERQVKIWFQNRRAKERRALKKHEDQMSKEKMDAAAHAAAAVASATMSAFTESLTQHHHHHHPHHPHSATAFMPTHAAIPHVHHQHAGLQSAAAAVAANHALMTAGMATSSSSGTTEAVATVAAGGGGGGSGGGNNGGSAGGGGAFALKME